MSHNIQYIKSIETLILPHQTEVLSQIQKMNEYILTRLRTSVGINSEDFYSQFNHRLIEEKHSLIEKLKEKSLVIFEKENLKLSTSGFMVADEIALQLFYEE